MFGSSAGGPYSHHATATSPSHTSAACARPSRTRCSLRARLPSAPGGFSADRGWNHVHQQPPHTPLCLAASAAKASHVSGPSGLTVYSLMLASLMRPRNRFGYRERNGPSLTSLTSDESVPGRVKDQMGS